MERDRSEGERAEERYGMKCPPRCAAKSLPDPVDEPRREDHADAGRDDKQRLAERPQHITRDGQRLTLAKVIAERA